MLILHEDNQEVSLYPCIQKPEVNPLQALEMQRYIDISPYRDTLGNDTVLIHI